MAKARLTISVPDHISEDLAAKARLLGSTPTEYAANVVKWWYGQGSPALTSEEARLRAERSPKAKATPKAS